MDTFQKELILRAELQDGRPYTKANVDLVHSALHYRGALRDLLTPAQYLKAYLLCNGFGDIDENFAYDAAFDWSHVRDSSPIGFDRAAEYLRSLGL